MNRIVIIGNGFDLAYGLKTKYEDFLVWYLKKSIDKCGYEYSDKSIEIIRNRQRTLFSKSYSAYEKMEEFINNGDVFINSLSQSNKSHCSFEIKIKSIFLSKILQDKNWTDIEKTYFQMLLSIINPTNNSNRENQINRLNSEFNHIKEELIEYISTISFNVDDNSKIFNFLDKCYIQYKDHLFYGKKEKKIDKVYFINFNYTNLLIEHLQHRAFDHKDNYNFIPIHGSVQRRGEIIFGYGDDTHPKYVDIENMDQDEYLFNIKSFYYPTTFKYETILSAIDSDEFDVIVAGHSLGLSDRVLLKTIFEHEKCKAIRLFHRGNIESHFRKRIALSRHFENKAQMRKKIVRYSSEDVLK